MAMLATAATIECCKKVMKKSLLITKTIVLVRSFAAQIQMKNQHLILGKK